MKLKSYVECIRGRWGNTYYIKGDEYVGKSLKNYGEYNPDETEHILALAAETDGWILDIGANIGVISQALQHEGYNNIIAFEPQREVYEILKMNCAGINCYNVAVGAGNGSIKVPTLNFSKHDNFGGVSVGGNCGRDVDLVALDEMPEVSGLHIGLMKIDVEGFENEVLLGARKIIERDKPIIYLEADREDKLVELERTLEMLGYSIVPHNPPLYREKNFLGKKRNVWSRNFASYNWECRPKCP